MMSLFLAQVICDAGMVKGFSEVRRFVDANKVTVNDIPVTEWNRIVHPGDIIKLGKHKKHIVR